MARYPGPLLARISGWYDAYHCYEGDRHLDQLECHRRYGPIVRYGPDLLLFNTPRAVDAIYTHARQSGIIKSDNYKYLHNEGTSILAVVDPEAHAFKRRMVAQAFSDQSLRGLEPLVIEKIDAWVAMLGGRPGDPTTNVLSARNEAWSAPRNMTNWANYLTFDILGELCFGKSFDMLTSEKNRELTELTLKMTRMFHIVRSPIHLMLGVC